MSLRRQKNKDSLDLLLDTMCNTFGGIILIAILVALLAGGRLQLASPRTSEDASRLRAQAVEELSRLQTVAAALRQRIVDERLERKVELLSQMDQLQAQIAALNRGLKTDESDLHQLETLNPKEQKAALAAKLEQVREQMSAAQQEVSEARKLLAARQKTLMNMEGQVRSVVEASVLRLRYPKEHQTGKNRLYVLVKYGRLYPTILQDGSRNYQTIDWTEIHDESIAKPQLRMGIDPVRDPNRTDALFAGIDSQTRYVAFIVFQDSFSEYGAAQRYCIRHNLEYGWVPQLQSRDAVFSSTGKNPLPQ